MNTHGKQLNQCNSLIMHIVVMKCITTIIQTDVRSVAGAVFSLMFFVFLQNAHIDEKTTVADRGRKNREKVRIKKMHKK